MTRHLCLMLLITVLAGCSTALPPRMSQEELATARPLDVLSLVTAPVAIGRLEPVMPAGQKVGSIYSRFGKPKVAIRSGIETSGNYRKYFYEELRKAGYETAGNETIFEVRDLDKAKIVIGGDIVDARVNVFQSVKEETVEYAITILWRVFDRETRREIFQTQTRGMAKDEVFVQAEGAAFRAAFLKLLSESAFVDAVRKK